MHGRTLTHPHRRLAVPIGLLAAALHADASVRGYLEPDAADPPDLQPMMVVTQFLDALDRAPLSVFGVRITRDQVVPRRVQFVYDLTTRGSTRAVYAELQPSVALPGNEDCELVGIDVRLDAYGVILDTSAHVWCE